MNNIQRSSFFPPLLPSSRNTLLGNSTHNWFRLPTSNDVTQGPQYLLALIHRLLEQLNQNDNDDMNSDEEYLTLSNNQQQLLLGLFAADTRGNLPVGAAVSVIDGANKDGLLSAGDAVNITGAGGQLLDQHLLSTADLYDFNFRENLTARAASLTEGGWDFDADIVKIRNNSLSAPYVRSYTDGNGISGAERVLEANDYWEVVERGTNRLIVQRQLNDFGRPVSASDALQDLFDNRQNYAFDCASPMRVLNLMATLDTVGENDFNTSAGRLEISSWYDQHDNSLFDGGFLQQGSTLTASSIRIDGVWNLPGELAMFDPAQGDELRLGSTYYFDRPGDLSTAFQGWNVLYMGKNGSGAHQFWAPSLGIEEVDFIQGTWIPADGAFRGYYLGSMVGSPDINKLLSWDTDQSV